jgi:hypothetical protein
MQGAAVASSMAADEGKSISGPVDNAPIVLRYRSALVP